ncbi:MAG TPA: hypothetical protein VFW87_07875, partial [Pirellulales bacterium]|nr:hypothetical protein [Pirellulales bacterium]
MKPPIRYWFCRLYVLFLWPLMLGSVLSCLYLAGTRHDERWFLLCFAWVPLLLPMVSMMLTLGAFPFEFSAFGKCIRSPLPAETPIRVLDWGGILIGDGMRAPGTLIIYPSGLGMKLAMVGTVFLPRDAIDAVERTRWWGLALHHHCPEIKTPVYVTPKMADMLFQ